MLDQHRNLDFWKQIGPTKWEFKGISALQKDNEVQIDGQGMKETFVATNSLECNKDSKYITIGKGWP